MMKKILLSIALFTIIVSLASCGGSGSGSSSEPIGINPGIPSIVQLLPLQIVAQTNTSIDFRAKVLDGNGNPVKNEPVTFTNLSPIGVINPQLVAIAGGVSIAAGGPVVVNTDELGFATITLYSTTYGFATVQAEVNTGLGQVRDSKTIYFTTGSLNLLPDLILDVDGDGDGVFNETGDFIFFETTTDDTAQIRATVYDRFGLVESYSTVTFGADVPYRIGPDSEAACSDGSDACEVFFMFGNTANTNSSGQASVFVQITSPALRNIQTLFNVTAVADNWAADLVTLFVQPVTVATVVLSANPTAVEPEGTSDITAFVTTNLGTIVPDGTAVSFRTDPADSLIVPPPVPLTDPDPCGSIIPFAQTTDGVAEVEFTAPATEGTCTITGTSVGVSGTVDVIVATVIDLSVNPPTQTINGVTGGVATFTIFNGTPGYSIFSSDPLFSPVPTTVAASGGTFTVTVPAASSATTVTYTIMDAVGDTVTATLIISGPATLAVSPSATLNLACGGNALNYTITGGMPPYSVVSGNPLIIISGGPFTTDPDTFTATSAACVGGVGDTDVDIVVTDSDSPPSTVTVTITENDP